MSGLLDIIKQVKSVLAYETCDFNFILEDLKNYNYLDNFEREFDNLQESYWLHKPFAKAVITEEEYFVLEPKLEFKDYMILKRLQVTLREKIVLDNNVEILEKDKEKEKILFNEFAKECLKNGVPVERMGRIWYYIYRDFLGYGKIDPVLRDKYIEDISCSGYNLPVYVYHSFYGSLRTNIVFRDRELDNLILKLAQKADTQVSLEKPLADATLPTGERIQITYRRVISVRGSTFSIRKTRSEPLTSLDLIKSNTIDAYITSVLWLCVDCRFNLLIAGSTASGKTTMLNAVSLFIPKNAKIVSIEDTKEIRLPHENWTPLLAKDADEMFELLKASLRQRPEFLLVGEVRGREAITMFQAMNTGHTTYSTLHAGDADSAINRLIHEPINVPPAMFEALDLLAVLRIDHISGRVVRRLKTLYLLDVSSEFRIEKYPVIRWIKSRDSYEVVDENFEILIKKIEDVLGCSREFINEELERRVQFISNLVYERLSISDLLNIVNKYRRDFYGRL